MANNILKEAIADAKAVREVALANAKAALEEAFTPKLQSMLSAKLSEDLDETEDMEEMSYGMGEAEDMEETYDMEEADDMEEITGMENEAEDMEENLDEEIDLEEILNELELEEGEEAEEKTVDEYGRFTTKTHSKIEKDEKEEEKLDEMGRPIYKAEDANYTGYTADRVHEGEEFNLDALLEEINNLDETEVEEEYIPGPDHSPRPYGKEGSNYDSMEDWVNALKKYLKRKEGDDSDSRVKKHPHYNLAKTHYDEKVGAMPQAAEEGVYEALESELEETKSALETVRTELNEVNLLNSKLLYVNRIFKANTLDEGQKLRVVETLDKAETAKEAKLIYETIKDTFNVAKSKKASFKNKTKSLKEGIGMASKTSGTTQSNARKEVISESNDMMKRFQKLANIKIN
jgi:hypothetical protein